ncbi:MAG: cobalamin B12-binding domain-containing protein, partial [Phycisphaerae bacterium]
IACRDFTLEKTQAAVDCTKIYADILWPAMERIDQLYRADRINAAAEHMAVRICRSIADQLQLSLKRSDTNGKRLLITCADGEPEELGAQMTADLFEARGWDVYFLGGGVPNDEILSLAGQLRPDMLLIFGTQPTGVPGVRQLIDLIREIGANPTMNIMVSGGVFGRADGLWKEVSADLFAKTAMDAIPLAETAEPRKPTVRPLGAPKKRRRRRRSPLLEESAATATT